MTVEITLEMPEELLKRVQAIGLQIADLPALIEAQLVQREQQLQRPPLRSFTDLADRMDTLSDELKPTPDEITEIVRSVQKERAAARRNAK